MIVATDDESMTVDKIRGRVAQQQARGGCDVVFVDYLQRLKPAGKKQDRYRDVDEIAQDLKGMAKALNIPVVVAAQFNLVRVEQRPLITRDDRSGKEVEKRIPEDSDFRESGNIYNEADVVLGLYRRSRWDPECDQTSALLCVMKNRHGRSDEAFAMRWMPERTMYGNATIGDGQEGR